MRPGPLIAIYVLLLYFFLAPVVLFGIFVFFDRLGRSRDHSERGMRPNQGADQPSRSAIPDDPAVWTARDIRKFRDQA